MSFSLPHDHGHNDIDILLANQLHKDSSEELAELFSLLADNTRLRIFWVLCHSEECVINLSAILNMSSPAISHHLKLLKSAGLITSRREGKEVYYLSADCEKARILHETIESLSALCCPEKKD